MSITLHSQEVNVDRKKLIVVLKKNLDKHIREYQDAMNNYRLALIGDCEKVLSRLNYGMSDEELAKVRVDFVPPQSHIEEYQQVIDILTVSVDENVSLDSHAFQAYYKDNWHWKKQFSMSAQLYATKAMSK